MLSASPLDLAGARNMAAAAGKIPPGLQGLRSTTSCSTRAVLPASALTYIVSKAVLNKPTNKAASGGNARRPNG